MEKTVVLNQNRDFMALYHRGRKIVLPYVILYVRKTRRNYNRLGITVGKKVGCAVKRSRARRIIRQAYREIEQQMPTGLDLVIVALPSIDGISSTKLRDVLADRGIERIAKAIAPPASKDGKKK
jgi:ribonuclease P protein component